ncbi:imidazolonepropionase [soil metagenome]
MPVLTGIRTLATCRAAGLQRDIHTVEDAALVWEGDTIRWAGPERELPAEYAGWEREDAGGSLVIPGLVDCHTHLAFAGWRADEFAERIAGAEYREIARRGGGIMRTVRATRAASRHELRERAARWLREMGALGVTTVECKSGYGLTLEDELKLLRVYRDLAAEQSVRIVATLLGAHVLPPEYADRRDAYVELLTEELIPRVAEEGLARFCDVFVEDTAFSPKEARTILAAAAKHGLAAKLHADQLGDGGGAALAAEVGAVSADHLEHTSEEGIRALAEAGVVAVSLPFAALDRRQLALPARRFLDAGVAVAVASDFNPGTAPSFHLPLGMMLACTMQGMTPAEALKGTTIIAARAIGMEGEIGSLEPGKRADFVVLDAPDVEEWLYHFRANAAVRTVIGGTAVAGGVS